MKTQRRWLNNVVKEAARTKVDMPWSRDTRRAALLAKTAGTSNSGLLPA